MKPFETDAAFVCEKIARDAIAQAARPGVVTASPRYTLDSGLLVFSATWHAARHEVSGEWIFQPTRGCPVRVMPQRAAELIRERMARPR
jgi:hypothetical protein